MRVPAPIAYIVVYVALYAAFGAASPFWPKFFETRALASQQIGLILAAAMLTRLVSGPLVAMLGDRLGSLRPVLAACAAVAASAAVALLWADTFWLLLVVALAQAAALAPTTSIADALSVNTVRPRLAGRPFEYGWIRGAASAAFVLGTLIAGQLVSPADLTPVIWMNAAFLIAATGATALLPGQARSQRSPPFAVSEMKALISLSQFRMMIIASALIYGSHAVHDVFAVIRWSDAGISTSTISFLWSEAVVAEVLVFMLAGPALLDRFGVRGAAVLAAAAGIVRWSVAGVTTSVLLLSLIQPLHGLTFALLHLACMRMMGVLVAASVAATAQALYAFGSGLLTAVLIYLSGALYASYAGRHSFAWRRSASSRSRSPGLASPMGGADPSVQRKGNGCRSTLRRKANWDCAFCRAPSASSAVGRSCSSRLAPSARSISCSPCAPRREPLEGDGDQKLTPRTYSLECQLSCCGHPGTHRCSDRIQHVLVSATQHLSPMSKRGPLRSTKEPASPEHETGRCEPPGHLERAVLAAFQRDLLGKHNISDRQIATRHETQAARRIALFVDLADVRRPTRVDPILPASLATDDLEIALSRELRTLGRR